MNCECDIKNKISDSESLEFEEKYLEEIKVDGDNWKTLYKCKICGSFWEEIDLGGRFGVEVELVKVSEEHVSKNWEVNVTS